MLNVTEKANEVIQKFLEDKEGTPSIRVFLSEGGWSGPALGMALDEPRETDEVIEEKGISFVIDKELLDRVKPISVDFVNSAMGSGFSISSSLKKAAGGCGSSCSAC